MQKIKQRFHFRFIFMILAVQLLAVFTCQGQSSGQNYIMRAKVLVPGITSESALNAVLSDPSKVRVSIQYFDGLGREMQILQQKASPLGKDIIQPILYDSMGRQTKQYLPYVSSGTADGSYRSSAVSEQQSFYNSPPAGVTAIPSGSGQVAYSETKFEASPLMRVQQLGFPGADWKIGGSHTQRQGQGINGINDIRNWIMTSSGASGTTYFPKNRLYTDTLTDEDGYKTISYTDMDKKVLLKKVQDASGYLSTYYIYDDMDNLRYVLPPGFTPTSFVESDAAFEQFAYGYHYNGKKQVVRKKIPGKGWEYFVYNKIDQLMMSQDGNQRAKSPQEWTIFKYDEIGRLVLTGIYSHSGSSANTDYLSAQQSALDGNSNLWETSLSTGTGYTANSYPSSWDRTLTINYFDSYDIPGKTSTYNATQSVTTRLQGLATGSKVNMLGTSDLLLTVNYYDQQARLLESVSDNHLGGIDRVINSWNFADELTASTRTHTSSGGSVTIANRYEYDHMGRKTKTYEQIGSDAEILLAELGYNELGQVYTKSLHNGSQTITHSYNSRGWLTGKSAPLFAMALKYTDGTSPRYNGNITNQLWGTPGSLGNTFTYSYDPLNRLTAGDTGTGIYEKDISYDNMGNITSLNRNGTGTQAYSYSGNQLGSVTGGVSRSYSYDANGNALSDGTHTISYNLLNLPSTVSGGTSMAYTYDALGRKLRRVSGGTTTDYVAGIQYTGGAIDFIQTEEGLARKSGSNYLYEYALTDHLGNNRLTFDIYSSAAREIQHDSYYPFGKTFNSYTLGTRNQYLYNGKEFQEGLAQYDYGARFYDAVVARWTTADPHAEKYPSLSTYNYVYNNPLKHIDPDGKDGIVSIKGNVITISSNIYLYGSGATAATAKQMQSDITKSWGTNNGKPWSYDDGNGNKYNVKFNVSVSLYEGKEKNDPTIIPESWNPNNRDNFIEIGSSLKEVGRSFVQGGDEGEWRGVGRNGMSLSQDDPAAHEFGHLMGLGDRYTDGKGADSGWGGNVMGKPAGKGKVEQKNINGILLDVMKAFQAFQADKNNINKTFRYEINDRNPGN